MTRKPILCLDFDGVLHSYTSGWKGANVVPDPPVPGAMAFLLEAVKSFDVHVYSSRSGQRGGIWIPKWRCEIEPADPSRGQTITLTTDESTATEKGLV